MYFKMHIFRAMDDHEKCSGIGSGTDTRLIASIWGAEMRHGHRGGGFFAGGSSSFNNDSEDFSRGRKFGSEDLQLLLLALLSDAPRHGYELIKLLEARSDGFYTPSPGMVYPALTYLEELGFTTLETAGNRKLYALTETGQSHLEKHGERVAAIWAKLSFFARRMGTVRRALAGHAVEEGPDPGEPRERELSEAHRKLKHALLARMRASSEEQLRIARILERAVSEIEADPLEPR